MAEEFFESEVVFSDHHRSPLNDYWEVVAPPQPQQHQQQQNSRGGKSWMRSGEGKKTVKNSVPVNIPERMPRWLGFGEEEEEGMVPPHVIVGRRIDGKMASSVCTGNGRTLKGRDLSQVRNSILRLTGFLEV
ncbi:protein S40-1-like [Gastrolobium bilobum]|uniref:protein S40-1-like n=1 Tax=Gastrolobium bilobum TaxID=150636 RepID=UPI002AAFD697|nr:protein S40-1-like [Gastrolobium bilobum]